MSDSITALWEALHISSDPEAWGIVPETFDAVAYPPFDNADATLTTEVAQW